MTKTLQMLEALYAILNDPSRSAATARMQARERIRVYQAELGANKAAEEV